MLVEMTPDDQARLQDVAGWFERAQSEHRQYEERWDHQDRLYYGHKRFVKAHSESSPRDRDSVLMDGRKAFGAELHIPYVFSSIETIMPRTISNRPKMLWLPADKTAEPNVENVTFACDRQQQKMDYELKLQSTIRSGLKHGLGIQKLGWRFDERDTFALREDVSTGQWVRTPIKQVAWDDPDVDDVDIRDFFWDPYADSISTRWKFLHRTWRNTAYVMERIEGGHWDRYPGLTAEDISNGGGAEQHSGAWAGRRSAAGLTNTQNADKDLHEIWEFHDYGEVITVIDRAWIVAITKLAEIYWHAELPFHGYRPIEDEHKFVGVGVIDPMEDLQLELNWLRTDRRWNAMLKLHQAYAFNDGVVDPSQIKIGPGRLVPVNGDPRDLLVPLTVGDIPNSGYQEEAALRADIQLTTGVDDTVSGSDGGGSSGAAQTATGVQLVQAAAGLRIQAYTRRAELELIKPEARQMLKLNQQRWTENKDIALPAMPTIEEPDRRWAWRSIGPAQLAGEFVVEPEGGATAPDNTPQKRQDAIQLLQAFQGNPLVDQGKIALKVLEKFDIAAPESYLVPEQTVPPETLDLLQQLLVEQAGMDPAGAHALIANALNAALDQQGQQQPDEQRPQLPRAA